MAEPGNYQQSNALYGEFMFPRRSNALVDNWSRGNGQEMRSSDPRLLGDRVAEGVANALMAAGVEGRTAYEYGHRAAGLAGTFGAPFALAHDTGALAGEGMRDGNTAKTAAAVALGVAGAAAPYAVRGMTRLPSFEAQRDAQMAARFGSMERGSVPGSIEGPFKDTWMGAESGQIFAPRTEGGMWDRGKMLQGMNRMRPENVNSGLTPSELRNLFRVVD